MQSVILVALGGAIGAVLRHSASVGAIALFGRGFPIGTLIVNVLGSFALGLLVGVLAKSEAGPELKLFLGTGLCGALTTFSTFSVETLALVEEGRQLAAAGNLILNVAFGFGAAAAGLAVAGRS